MNLFNRGNCHGQSLRIFTIAESKLRPGQFRINVSIGGAVPVAKDNRIFNHDNCAYNIVDIIVKLIDKVKCFLQGTVHCLDIQRHLGHHLLQMFNVAFCLLHIAVILTRDIRKFILADLHLNLVHDDLQFNKLFAGTFLITGCCFNLGAHLAK